jgi:hypothetical protein
MALITIENLGAFIDYHTSRVVALVCEPPLLLLETLRTHMCCVFV